MTAESFAIDSIIVAVVAGLFTIAAWISSRRTKREEARQEREKLEVEAYVRAQSIYTTAIETQTKQLERANARIEQLERKPEL